jgi:hypothetical protein
MHTELLIPTVEQGQMFALSFYYGRILSVINGIIQSRNTFKIIPEDGEKATAYIVYRGQHCQEVSTWRKADNQNVQMQKDSKEYREAYRRAFDEAQLKNSAKPEWMNETTFRVLHSLKHLISRQTVTCAIEFMLMQEKNLDTFITIPIYILLLTFSEMHVLTMKD